MGICHHLWLRQVQCDSTVEELVVDSTVEELVAIVEVDSIVVELVVGSIVEEPVAIVEVDSSDLFLCCGVQRYHKLGSLGTWLGQHLLGIEHRLERSLRQQKELRRSPIKPFLI